MKISRAVVTEQYHTDGLCYEWIMDAGYNSSILQIFLLIKINYNGHVVQNVYFTVAIHPFAVFIWF